MTHTLHRRGTSEEQKHDYIVFAMAAQGINSSGAVPKLRRIFEIVSKYEPINFGDVKTGNKFQVTEEEIKANLKENSYIHFVFSDIEKVKSVLRELKEADVGLSVVVSGLVGEIKRICENIGLKVHTVEFSGGIFGKRELLPEEPVLEITTMCGHGLISANLVRHFVERIKKKKTSPDEASRELAKLCQCGVFNPEKARRILSRMAGNQISPETKE